MTWGRRVLSPIPPPGKPLFMSKKLVDKHWYVCYLDKHDTLAQYFCLVRSMYITWSIIGQ